MRRKAVVSTVPRQEGHRTVTDLADGHPITRPAERRVDLDFDRVVEQSVETRPADYADLRARSVDHRHPKAVSLRLSHPARPSAVSAQPTPAEG